MKTILHSLLVTLFVALPLLGPSVQAQTPDGETPANEGICDDLQADGITKGLYGLCVAFCEAQDVTDESDPVTDEELDAIANSAPSGKILANYNKKKKDTDPGMPCIVTEGVCPCWSAEELASIDGFFPSPLPADGQVIHDCDDRPAVTRHRETVTRYRGYSNDALVQTKGPSCRYSNDQGTLTGGSRIFRSLIISDEEYNSCKQSILEHCDSGL